VWACLTTARANVRRLPVEPSGVARKQVWVAIIGAALVIGAYNHSPVERELATESPSEEVAPAEESSVSEAFERLLDAVDAATEFAGSSTDRPASNDTDGCRGNRESGPYSGLPGCRAGGERVLVVHVVDGDTLRLLDGREVQLIGVDAPEADDCAGPDATEHARDRVEGHRVVLHREPGVDTDRSGRLLTYVRYTGPDTDYDLGYSLAYNALAEPYAAYAGNDRYTANIAGAAHQPARSNSCTQPAPIEESTDDETDVRSSDRANYPDRSSQPEPSGPGNPDAVSTDATNAVYYRNCSAARAAGAAPIQRGEPGYRAPLDADDDGTACEG
jgi:micrococcal nuclease